jgi:hypothetical protein
MKRILQTVPRALTFVQLSIAFYQHAVYPSHAAGIIEEVQVAPDGTIKDSVTSAEIAAAIKRGGITVDEACISMPEVTELGSVLAEVTLHPDVSVTIKVIVQKSKITITY